MSTSPPRPGTDSSAGRSSAPPATPGPGRPKDPAKGAAILEAARTLFIRHGFHGVSMDQIAAGAGVSKLTVYSHFGDKENLFSAAVTSYFEQQLPHALFERTPETALRERLLEIAHAFHAMATSPEAIAAHRMLCAPQLAGSPLIGIFWEAGPARLNQELANLLQRRAAAGELRLGPDDPVELARAAQQLIALLKGDAYTRLLLGLDGPDEAAASAHVAAAVDLFLRAYGTTGNGSPA